MQSKQYIVTLQEDTVISQNAVTTGGHRSLDYLPGSVILGAVAKHLYPALSDKSPESAWQVFHSGKVRFGNALPLSKSGLMGYPVPRSWFRDKDDLSDDKERIAITNYVIEDFAEGVQVQQYRGRYTTLDANTDTKLYAPTPVFRMKTAVNPKNGIAAEGQLFGYSSLLSGERFSFRLDADDDIDADLFAQVNGILLENTLYLGRSRSAEYGAVQIEEALQIEAPSLPDKPASAVTIWLLSDAAIYDIQGVPTLQPDASAIGLPQDWELDLERSFTYSRRFAPYNAKYQRRELEREVLGMGSVLHYVPSTSDSSEASVDNLQQVQNRGIGSYRQSGLGAVFVNPSLLEEAEPVFASAKPLLVAGGSIPDRPDNPIFRYLDQRANELGRNEKMDTLAEQWKQELEGLYLAAKKLSPYVQGSCIGPSATQWGRVMDASKGFVESISTEKDGNHYQALFTALFNKDSGICKKEDVQWDAQVVIDVDSNKASLSSFREWFIIKLKGARDDKELPDIVARFARLAKDVAQRKACAINDNETEVQNG